jgi:hypothetical protein
MRLEFKGIVETGDAFRVSEVNAHGAIWIGGVNVVDEIAEQKWAEAVRVLLNGELVANGNVVTELGYGYSEYTPVESDELNVGACDLIERLEALVGQEVTLVIEDQWMPC